MSNTTEEKYPGTDAPMGGFDDDLSDLKIPGFDDDAPAQSASDEDEPEDFIDQSADPEPAPAAKAKEPQDVSPKTLAETKGSAAKETAKKALEAAAKAEADEAKQAAEAAKATAKILKFKAGEQALEVAEDAVIEWKVDGKLVPIKARELLDNYAGKTAWEKKFQETANERKALAQKNQEFEATKARQSKLVVDMYDKMKAGKLLEAVQDLVELSGLSAKGIDGREYTKQLRTMLREQFEATKDLTPEQLRIKELEEEYEYTQTRYSRLDQQRKQEEAQRAFHAHMTKVAEEAKVEFDTLAQTMEFLKDWARKNNGDPGQITPESAVDHMQKVRSFEVARDAIAAVEPHLIKDDMVTDHSRWEDLAKFARKALEDGISPEEFTEIYLETRKTKEAIKVSEKLKSQPTGTVAKAATRAKPKNPDEDAFDFTKISKDDAIW